MQKNRGEEKHIVEKLRRTMIAMKMTLSIGKRIFKANYVKKRC